MSSGRSRLAVLLSGSGRTLVNLHERIERGEIDAGVGLVIASRECLGADRARERGLPTIVRSGPITDEEMAHLCREHDIHWITLAGYLRLAPIPAGFEQRVVNIHPALLPSFGGPGMYGLRVHRAVLDAGCKVSGCTVHLCDRDYDTGPILLQKCCRVDEDDTPESLAARVFELEVEAYPEALRLLLSDRVSIEGRCARIIES